MGTAKDFAQGLERFNDVAREKATRRLRRVSQKALEVIVDGTPVLTGCCKGNWSVSTDGALKRQFDGKKLDPNGAATVAAGRAKIESAVLGVAVYIENSTPYVIKLENGGSRQKPPGAMVAQPLATLKAAVEAGAT